MVSSISFAYGIAVSPDRKTVAVASSTECDVRLFRLKRSQTPSPTTPTTLELYARVPVPFHAANLDYDEDGALYVAGTLYFPALVKLAKGQLSPSATKAGSWASSMVHTASGVRNGTELPDNETRSLGKVRRFSDPRRTAKEETHAVKTVYQSDGSEAGRWLRHELDCGGASEEHGYLPDGLVRARDIAV